ncbi:MAG: hypothetical protein JWM53_5225 [bacterium]|nr:hypothetical protein [bacterium]
MREAASTATPGITSAAIGCASLLLAGCLPFFGSKPEPPRMPAMVERFAAEASALGIEPTPPSLPAVTRTLGHAVEALPWTAKAGELGSQIAAEAQAMEKDGAAKEVEHARRSLTLALQAADAVKKAPGSQAERERALAAARQAVESLAVGSPADASQPAVEGAYRAVARALLAVCGGGGSAASDHPLGALVARFAVEDSDQARRTGAQLVFAMASAFDGLPARPSKIARLTAELRKHAQRLADAATLDYAAQLKEALTIAVDALAVVERAQRFSALEALRAEGRTAVSRINAERPFELQRPAAQDAVRLLTDALTVAAAR